MGPPLKYRFNLEKFLASLSYLLEACGPMTKLKIVKLLYLTDRRHFNLYGRPVVGDRYVRMDLGPVPSLSKDLIDQLEEGVILHIKPGIENRTLSKYFKVDKTKKYPVISSSKKPDYTVLSQSDIEALDWVVKTYGSYAASTLVNVTHRHAAWKETKSLADIDYRLFPKDDRQATKGIVELVEAEQGERTEVIAAFSRVTPTRSTQKAILATR